MNAEKFTGETPQEKAVEQTELTEAPRTPAAEKRRTPGQIAGGVLLIALSGLGAGYLYTQTDHTEQAVVVQRDVASGSQLDRTDLVTQKITAEDGRADLVTSAQLDSLEGKWVVSDIPAGTILTSSMLTSNPAPKSGTSTVAVPMEPSRLPVTELHAGQNVRVVVGYGGGQNSGAAGAQAGDDLTPGQSWGAWVDAVGSLNEDGTQTVSLNVAPEEAAQIAAAASSGAVMLVLDAGETQQGVPEPASSPSASEPSPSASEPSSKPSKSSSSSSSSSDKPSKSASSSKESR